MDAFKALSARAEDPRWIPLIYSYCDRRCGRCRFNDRCFAYAEDRLEDSGTSSVSHLAASSLERASALIQAYAGEHGIDLNDGADTSERRHSMDVDLEGPDADPDLASATFYARLAIHIVRALAAAGVAERDRALKDALDTIGWFSTMIAPKVFRALSGRYGFEPMETAGAVQTDQNGSIKVARLMIDESIAAWRVVNDAGRAPPGAVSRRASEMLSQLDRRLALRFPLAMRFVRPGFDDEDHWERRRE